MLERLLSTSVLVRMYGVPTYKMSEIIPVVDDLLCVIDHAEYMTIC